MKDILFTHYRRDTTAFRFVKEFLYIFFYVSNIILIALGYRASLLPRRFRRVRHLAEKRLLTLGYTPLTGRPFFAPPSAVHEYTDARFHEPAFAPDFAEATAGRAEFAGATIARDPVLLCLAAPSMLE
jgi:hypothetical protein